MKRSVVLLFSLLLAASAFAGEPLTDTDRDKLVAHLDKTSAALLASVEGLTEAQWNYRAAEGRWTIAEIAEHIAVSEKMMLGVAADAMKQPTAADVLADARKDDMLLSRIPDRGKKFKTSEPLEPANRFPSPAAAVEAFKAERAEVVKLARTGGDLRAFAAKGPVGNLDAYGWLLFTSTHSERHTKQIEEVKADAGFPR